MDVRWTGCAEWERCNMMKKRTLEHKKIRRLEKAN